MTSSKKLIWHDLEFLKLVVTECHWRNAEKKVDRLLNSLLTAKQDVLMLNGKPTIVARHAQAIVEIAPPALTIAVTRRNLIPQAPGNIHQRTVFQSACKGGYRLVDHRVFGMRVIICITRHNESIKWVGHPNLLNSVFRVRTLPGTPVVSDQRPTPWPASISPRPQGKSAQTSGWRR